MKVKEDSEKVDLKLRIQKTKMASGPISKYHPTGSWGFNPNWSVGHKYSVQKNEEGLYLEQFSAFSAAPYCFFDACQKGFLEIA